MKPSKKEIYREYFINSAELKEILNLEGKIFEIELHNSGS